MNNNNTTKQHKTHMNTTLKHNKQIAKHDKNIKNNETMNTQ